MKFSKNVVLDQEITLGKIPLLKRTPPRMRTPLRKAPFLKKALPRKKAVHPGRKLPRILVLPCNKAKSSWKMERPGTICSRFFFYTE